MKRVALVMVLLSAFVACGKEEWNQQQLGVGNPYETETDDTEPATDDSADAAIDSEPPADASSGDATDARPADARADARDATTG